MSRALDVARSSSDDISLPFGGPVYDEREINAVVEALRSGDLATGRITRVFESEFAENFGFSHAVAVTSGSTANLLALAALRELGRLRPGDRVVVSGATFVSAVAPVVQLGLVPVFVDLAEGDVNVDLDLVEQAITAHDARGLLLPHALGVAMPMDRLADIKRRHGVFLIEDCCESLGAAHGTTPVGAVADVATFSFYAGHHLTMGEGGMLACHSDEIDAMLRSLRAFGRSSDYSGGRFAYEVGDRPLAPEERYIHLRLGYNGKITDLQAAFGRVQLTRHIELAEARREIARALAKVLADHNWQVLGDPCAPTASPFAVAVLLPPGLRNADVAETLLHHGIDFRGFLGASQAHQPCFDQVETIVHEPYQRAKDLGERGLLLGCPPGIDPASATAALRAALEALA
ncbi:DegT/DnrJ/EryC1/StrS family aminotransferase [Streptomyces sp. SP17KL33]|uniref:DegT/DnrJ/EryC1/StrS family aminotransferase n=1 Tax=Streptomyces sp. SP17KL33 TaxID=3002534 RepID=UPI002E760678|nr:DegT/DnrJ/EryC1/StrS aminotransferase family protein [Streptomyces sp. SP17KL33]MEE1831705.1 DegT/DnrJ/EryC1/StrS aminotransferase family protein [Streptomyces sp. SP17KL33]